MNLRGPGGHTPHVALPPPRPRAEAVFASARHVEVIEGFAAWRGPLRCPAGFIAQFLAQEVIGEGLELPRRREAQRAYAPARAGGTTLVTEA